MPEPHALIDRLESIGRSLAASGHALALIGLGSAGLELERLDAHSDLDFFAVVEDGYKPRYLENLDWLGSTCPIAYQFRNTPDGYKLLFTDGIYCEFGVFERPELSTLPFTKGRVVWKSPEVEESIGTPASRSTPAEPVDIPWLVGEAITNLYVGLARLQRGEKLSAGRFIQQYAVDRVVALAKRIEKEQGVQRDPFDPTRRFERRFPVIAREMPSFIQGYERSAQSAQAILETLERHFDVAPAMAGAIREYLKEILSI